MGTVKEFEDLDFLFKQFGVLCVVVDSLPETHKVKELQAKYKMVWRCSYFDNVKDMQKDEKARAVDVDRTQSLDDFMKSILTEEIHLPKNFDSLDNGDVLSQLTASIRRFDEKRQKYIWDEGVRKDHYHHAGNYAKIALKLFDVPVQIFI